MTVDHVLSWEIARAGGLVAYLLVGASVIIGMLVSLKLRSPAWPRFLSTEVHRFVTLLAIVFTAIHGMAVWIDPFTGFTPAEVLIPMVGHYRPLWVALGIVGAYLMLAVWASEYVRGRIGYGWWRRLHYGSFAVFVLATLHGIGAGSDTRAPWALAIYGGAGSAVFLLVVWRLTAVHPGRRRRAAWLATAVAMVVMVGFTALGPAQPKWNAVANNGNGSGASDAWLADHPATPAAPGTFTADLSLTITRPGTLDGTFAGAPSGSIHLTVGSSTAVISLALDDGWSCDGFATGIGKLIVSDCVAVDGTSASVELSTLRESAAGLITGQIHLAVPPSG